MTSSVSSDSTNQPVRNTLGAAWNTDEQHAEREEVEDRAQQPELDHEAADEAHVPAPRPVDQLGIDAVVGDPDRRECRTGSC